MRSFIMRIEHWLIEHPSFGVLNDWDHDTHWPKITPRFKYSGARSDTRLMFYSLAQAKLALARVRASNRRGMDKCYVLHWNKKDYVIIKDEPTIPTNS